MDENLETGHPKPEANIEALLKISDPTTNNTAIEQYNNLAVKGIKHR